MIDIQKYIINERVSRAKIAMDVANRKITHEELEEIIKNPVIAEAFYGDGYKEKSPQTEWNKNYLNKLSCAVVSAGFNEDYLFYLEKVANYVAECAEEQDRMKKRLVAGIATVALIVVAVIAIVFFLKNKL